MGSADLKAKKAPKQFAQKIYAPSCASAGFSNEAWGAVLVRKVMTYARVSII
jgi:hypothetical protein